MADLNAIQRFNLRKQALLESQDDYDEGENRANKAFTNIENRIGNNRDELTKVYDDYASRTANSTTLSDYYANRLVLEKAATKLGENTIFDQIGDLAQGVYTGATGGMAKILEGIRETGDAIGSISNMNPSKLYKVATGKADAKTKIESGLTYLNARHAQFPENNDITELYNLVNNGFDKDPGEYKGVSQIYSLVNKINDFTNALDVKLFQDKYTQDEYEAQRLQQLKTNLSYESDIAKGIQTGGQILGEQVPGILVANAAGGIANNLRNAVGLSKLSTAGKVGALTMLGLEAKGGAYREAISEGANFSQANAYSDQAAMAEVLSEVFGGESVNAFLGLGINLTPAGRAVKDALDGLGIKNKWIRAIINVGGELTAEGWEEVFTALVDPIFKEATYGKKVDWENMPKELLSEFVDSLIPTAMMMGLGRPQINLYIDNATKDLNTRVLNSTDITDADKIRITAELNNLANDAKRMIEDDFDGTLAKVESEFNQKVEANNALKKKALDLIDRVETNQNLTDEQKDRYNQRILDNSGVINNTNRMTRQEATDLGKTSNVQYANTEQVNNATANEGVTVKQELNGVQRAVKDLFDRVTGGQIVYTENPAGVYGFTNNDGNFYVDGNQNTINTMRAATHEIGHMATEKDPTLMDDFNKKARPTVQQINAYMYAVGNLGMTPAEAKAEMLNDVIAYIATKQKNLSRFEDSTRNALEKIGELFFGTENSSRPSNYALGNADYQKIELYVSPEILNDAEFENKVVEALLSLKDGKQTQKVLDKGKKITKEASKTKETNKETPKTDKEKAYAKIEEKYKKMRGAKSPEAIKKMIADELNLKYNGPKDNSSDANEVRRVYQDLKDHSGTLFSKRKIEPDNNTKYSTYGKNMPEDEAHPADLYIAFDPRQVDLVDNTTPTNDPDMRYSIRKGESNTEKIINNQRNELVKQQDKADRLEAENKGLKKINKGIKSTGRTRIRELKRESDKMLKVGRETELKLKGQLEKEGRKYNRLAEYAVDLKYETQLDKKAQADRIKYGREYKNLFIGLRREGKSITEAYNFTKEIYEASQELNNSIDSSMKILNDIRKKKVYNKLPKELKAKIDSYEQIWTGSRKQADLMLARRILDSATAKEYLGKVALSKGARNKIMNLEGDDFEGKGTISLEPLFNGSIGLAKSFEQGLIDLQNEIKEFQSTNKQKERTIELSDDIADIQVAVENEAKEQGKSKLKGLKKNVLGTNKTLGNSLMTLKTEIQALMGGNIHTPVMKIQDNLQKGETRKKQSITEVYRILNTFMEKSKGINRVIGTQTWNKSLENSLSNKAKFTDTGMSSTGDNGKSVDIKLPRHMMMSLAMHLANDDNMLHISGGIVGISTDENGNTRISPIKGMGVRIPDETLYRRGQIKDAYDAGVTVKLTQEQVEKIVDMLTPEELAFVDATKEVFKYTTSLINEVSNRIVGYDMATVENYFPIRVWDKGGSSGAVLNVPFQKRYGDALAYMLSPGWLQERTTSTNPIYLENIADVMNRVVNNVTNFYGYAEALRDNHIMLDSTMGNGTELNKNIDTLSSSFMPNYTRLTRFITGQESLRDGRFRGLMAMNTLTFNVGTWLTQPMSFFNAMKYFSTKEFMTSINPINNNVKLNNMIRDYFKEIGIDSNEYSDYELARAFISMATPNLDYRAIGYKTPAINQLFNKSLQQKIGAHGIELFDDIAVTALARMMAYSVSLDENIEFGSEKYFEELGNRLTEVLVETQPEFSQVNRANMFRSTSPILRTLSLFGTPANQMFNNFAQSAMQVRYEAREGKISNEAKVSLAKSISGIIISSAMVGLVRALRDSIRDDEDKDDFRDRWSAQTIVALLGPTLILDDVAQFIMSTAKFGGMNSYDFNTPETTFMNGITNLAEKLMQLGKEDVSAAKKTTDIIKAMGVITPIDTKSVVRVFEALMKFVAPDLYQAYALQNSSAAYKAWLKNTDTPMSEFYRAYTATRQGELDKLGYHKADKSKGIESNLKETRRKALQQTFDSEADVNKYMEILFNYKS